MTEQRRPQVGVGIMILKDGKVLLGKRKNVHGNGEYGGTGGHLEMGESFEACARRETREETGIEITNLRFLCVTNLKMGDKHYVDIGMLADWESGDLQLMEPEKCEGWDWYAFDQLPSPLFGAESNYLEAFHTNRHYFDS